jgi:hypothetical protein
MVPEAAAAQQAMLEMEPLAGLLPTILLEAVAVEVAVLIVVR